VYQCGRVDAGKHYQARCGNDYPIIRPDAGITRFSLVLDVELSDARGQYKNMVTK
jgi:hypothetical protein